MPAPQPPLDCPVCGRPNYHPSDHHMVPKSRGGRVTTTICRDCHTAIHALFTNKELEQKYFTVDALLTHDEMRKMITFISKQDPGGRVRTRASKTRSRKR